MIILFIIIVNIIPNRDFVYSMNKQLDSQEYVWKWKYSDDYNVPFHLLPTVMQQDSTWNTWLFHYKGKWSFVAVLGIECIRNMYYWIWNRYWHKIWKFYNVTEKFHYRQGVVLMVYRHPSDFSEKWKFIVTPLLWEGG